MSLRQPSLQNLALRYASGDVPLMAGDLSWLVCCSLTRRAAAGPETGLHSNWETQMGPCTAYSADARM